MRERLSKSVVPTEISRRRQASMTMTFPVVDGSHCLISCLSLSLIDPLKELLDYLPAEITG